MEKRVVGEGGHRLIINWELFRRFHRERRGVEGVYIDSFSDGSCLGGFTWRRE